MRRVKVQVGLKQGFRELRGHLPCKSYRIIFRRGLGWVWVGLPCLEGLRLEDAAEDFQGATELFTNPKP